MSAQIVSDNEVLLIASCYCERLYDPLKLHDSDMNNVVIVAKELLAENYKSYNYRYSEAGSFPLDLSKWVIEGGYNMWLLRDYCVELLNKYSTVEKLKLVMHYQYQACEHINWKETRPIEISNDAKDKLIGQLPSYEGAPWGIE